MRDVDVIRGWEGKGGGGSAARDARARERCGGSKPVVEGGKLEFPLRFIDRCTKKKRR